MMMAFGAIDAGVRPQPATDTWYQIFINPAGVIADRRCWTDGAKRGKSTAWNGNWRIATSRGADFWSLELSCPLSDFGRVGEEWRVNASRYQARTREVSVWQAPLREEPTTFGLLQAPD